MEILKTPCAVVGLSLLTMVQIHAGTFREELLNDPALWTPPKVEECAEMKSQDIQAIFYEGVPFHGKETAVFAYVGVPGPEVPRPVPAVVLVHGGGGTAFVESVREWVRRGYAALAMDLEGHIPVKIEKVKGRSGWKSHDRPGPSRTGIFGDAEAPLKDQWPYHAVAAITRGISVLQSWDGVDKNRVGLSGTSWGGILSSIVAGLDKRIIFVSPIYGCGFLQNGDGVMGQAFAQAPESRRAKMLALWEPSNFIPHIACPSFWLIGTNDHHFSLNSWMQSADAAPTPTWRAVRLRMAHGGQFAREAPESYALAEFVLGRRPPFPVWEKPVVQDGRFEAKIDRPDGQKFTLLYTKSTGPWEQRDWQEETVSCTSGVVAGNLPPGATCLILNATAPDGVISSSPLKELSP